MKKSHVFGVLVAIALMIFSIAYPIPEKHIRVSSYSYGMDWTENRGEEYVGGDAYNYQMEVEGWLFQRHCDGEGDYFCGGITPVFPLAVCSYKVCCDYATDGSDLRNCKVHGSCASTTGGEATS